MRGFGLVVLAIAGSILVASAFVYALLQRLGVRPTFRWREWLPTWKWFFNPVAARELKRMRGKRFFLLVGIPAVALTLAMSVTAFDLPLDEGALAMIFVFSLHLALFTAQAMAAILAAVSIVQEKKAGALDQLQVTGLSAQSLIGGKLVGAVAAPAAVLSLSFVFYLVCHRHGLSSPYGASEAPFLLGQYGALPVAATTVGWACFGLACSATGRGSGQAVSFTLATVILLRALVGNAMMVVIGTWDPLWASISFVRSAAMAPLLFNLWGTPGLSTEYHVMLALGWTLLMSLVAIISFWFAVRRLQQRD